MDISDQFILICILLRIVSSNDNYQITVAQCKMEFSSIDDGGSHKSSDASQKSNPRVIVQPTFPVPQNMPGTSNERQSTYPKLINHPPPTPTQTSATQRPSHKKISPRVPSSPLIRIDTGYPHVANKAVSAYTHPFPQPDWRDKHYPQDGLYPPKGFVAKREREQLVEKHVAKMEKLHQDRFDVKPKPRRRWSQ